MKWAVFIISLLTSEFSISQNLVVNNSFEDFYTCNSHPANPQTNPQRPYGWFCIARTGITGYYLDIPGSTGERNLDLIIGSDYRELRTYWETVLLQKLQKGKRYKIKLSVASSFGEGPNLNDIGFYFADSIILTSKADTILQPAEYIGFLDSKAGKPKNRWFNIEKEFTATNNNRMLVVGNFSRKEYQKIATDRNRNSKYITIHVDDLNISPVEKDPCIECDKIRDSLYMESKNLACNIKTTIFHDSTVYIIYPLIVDTVVINTDILFASNSFAISNPDSLGFIRTILNKKNIIKIRVNGYTDDKGSVEYNKELSLKRARALADILITKFGVNKEIIEIQGYGISTKYAEKNKNRRVEIYTYRNRPR